MQEPVTRMHIYLLFCNSEHFLPGTISQTSSSESFWDSAKPTFNLMTVQQTRVTLAENLVYQTRIRLLSAKLFSEPLLDQRLPSRYTFLELLSLGPNLASLSPLMHLLVTIQPLLADSNGDLP
jgi:hypothetical protein